MFCLVAKNNNEEGVILSQNYLWHVCKAHLQLYVLLWWAEMVGILVSRYKDIIEYVIFPQETGQD